MVIRISRHARRQALGMRRSAVQSACGEPVSTGMRQWPDAERLRRARSTSCDAIRTWRSVRAAARFAPVQRARSAKTSIWEVAARRK